MRVLLLGILILSAQAFAQVSVIEFTIPDEGGLNREQRYRIMLDDKHAVLDEVHRMGLDGNWKNLFTGPVTYLQLPHDAEVNRAQGPRAKPHTLIRYANYSLKNANTAAGVRLRSDDKLVLLLPFNAAVVPWPGEIDAVVPLDRGYEMETGSNFFIFSIKAQKGSVTYMIVDDDFERPQRVDDLYHHEPLGARMVPGRILIDSLGKTFYRTQAVVSSVASERSSRKAFGRGLVEGIVKSPRLQERTELLETLKRPGATEVMDELIALLDDREPLESMDNAETLVRRAIRGLLLREFPRLRELESADPVAKQDMEKLLQSLTYLWFERKAVSGEMMRNTFIKRLEAAMEKRTRCELSLMDVEGPGSHAVAYYRGEAMRTLNALYRKLYK